jgi:hypothetical protein
LSLFSLETRGRALPPICHLPALHDQSAVQDHLLKPLTLSDILSLPPLLSRASYPARTGNAHVVLGTATHHYSRPSPLPKTLSLRSCRAPAYSWARSRAAPRHDAHALVHASPGISVEHVAGRWNPTMPPIPSRLRQQNHSKTLTERS